jgi:hypothetical protein
MGNLKMEDIMNKLKAFVVLIGIFFAVSVCFADDDSKLAGTWKLVSFVAEYKAMEI